MRTVVRHVLQVRAVMKETSYLFMAPSFVVLSAYVTSTIYYQGPWVEGEGLRLELCTGSPAGSTRQGGGLGVETLREPHKVAQTIEMDSKKHEK